MERFLNPFFFFFFSILYFIYITYPSDKKKYMYKKMGGKTLKVMDKPSVCHI